jgi:multiple sugar transport system substrate-binding protein
LSAGKRLTRYNGDTLEVSGLFFGTNYDTFNQAVWQNGGSILNEDKTAAAFNNTVGVEALTYMVNATQETTKGAAIGGFENLINAKTAMLFQGSVPRYANAAVNAKVSLEDINLSIAPPLKQKVAQAGVFSNWMGIGSQSKHPELAWEFLKFHVNFENYAAYCEASKAVPARMSLIGSQYVKSNPWLLKALKIASTQGRATWTAVEFTSLRDALNPELAKAMQGTITPEAALEGVTRIWNNILGVKR